MVPIKSVIAAILAWVVPLPIYIFDFQVGCAAAAGHPEYGCLGTFNFGISVGAYHRYEISNMTGWHVRASCAEHGEDGADALL